MAHPQYNSAVDIPTDTDTTGRWKAFMTNGTGNVSVQTFNGEGVTFEGVVAGTIYPIAFNKVFGSGTTVGNGELIGLN
tara:strand:- start:18 stop:251 length:234 start_codon:yes stop_codon:yes gene_type:complete